MLKCASLQCKVDVMSTANNTSNNNNNNNNHHNNNISNTELSIVFALSDETRGGLGRFLTALADHEIDLLLIETRRSLDTVTHQSRYEFLITVDTLDADRVRSAVGDRCRYFAVISGNTDRQRCGALTTNGDAGDGDEDVEEVSVPWFPRTVDDLDAGSKQIFSFGAELDADHPGFQDEVYRKRRKFITDLAANYKMNDPIPNVEYTPSEIETWNACFSGLLEAFPTHACQKYNTVKDDMFAKCGYRIGNVPQLEDVSRYVNSKTGFRIRPVAGLLSPRAFLAGLAFKVYHATQYMRHGSLPFYTPEPDICHELLGHLPLFADPDFAEFVHQIGLASLGASDEYTDRLSTCLWFTVEFGLCHENGSLRAFGGGLLSSLDELKYSLSDKPEVREFEPNATGQQCYPITEFQPVYYAAKSIEDARDQMIEYAKTIPRPFLVSYDERLQRMIVSSLQRPATG